MSNDSMSLVKLLAAIVSDEATAVRPVQATPGIARARRRRASRERGPAPVVRRRYGAPSRRGGTPAAHSRGTDRRWRRLERGESAWRNPTPITRAMRGQRLERRSVVELLL